MIFEERAPIPTVIVVSECLGEMIMDANMP